MTDTELNLAISNFAKNKGVGFFEACDILNSIGVAHQEKQNKAEISCNSGVVHHVEDGKLRTIFFDVGSPRLVKRTTVTEEFERV